MPKVSKIQSHFDSGEISQSVWGRVENDRYDAAMQTLINYYPILQGPLIRRPGTKYVTNVKDSTKPPILVPFKVSETQSYILEMGDYYMRFYSKNGQILVTGSSYVMLGAAYDPTYLPSVYSYSYGTGYSVRDNPNSSDGYMQVSVQSTLAIGMALEMTTPYGVSDLPNLKWTQKEDTLYFTHPSFRPYKLQRKSNVRWDLIPILLKDGPYLPFNTRDATGDCALVSLTVDSSNVSAFPPKAGQGTSVTLTTTPVSPVLNLSNNGSGYARLTVASGHSFQTGDLISVDGGNGSGSNTTQVVTDNYGNPSYWNAVVVGSTFIDVQREWLGGFYTSSVFIRPYVFKQTDSGRLFSYSANGARIWGLINQVRTGGLATGVLANPYPAGVISSPVWQLGAFYGSSWPSCSVMHQNRLYFAGSPSQPEELDGSNIGDYERFAASGSNYAVTDQNAVSFQLLSNDVNPLRWLKPSSQGLLAGSLSGEWQISPSNQNTGITPTNITAQQIASFGAANVDAVTVGNSVLYLQKASRKLRELNYFFQAGTFRSTNLSELAEHLTLPSLTQLTVQKEINPLIWGLRSDGVLTSLSYNRDELTIKAGWARHVLGGQSDAAGSPPVVKSMAIAVASSSFYEELWCAVQRSVAGSSVVTIEYMTRPFDYTSLQEDAYYLDCGATYDNPIQVTGITNTKPVVVTAPSHGLTASSQVRFYTAVGLNSSVVDVNGNKTTTNLVNYTSFIIASVSTNAFKLQDYLGNDVDGSSYTAYLGSAVVRKMVTNITGLTWLAGDTVSVLADGGIHVNTTVSSTGQISLAYPAAKVQVGYSYNSDAQTLRSKDGSAQGSSIGSTRRINRVAFMLHNVAEMSVGPTFTNLLPIEFMRGDANSADQAVAIVDGVFREGFQGSYTFDDYVCWRQSAPLPGMIQSITRFLEEQDV